METDREAQIERVESRDQETQRERVTNGGRYIEKRLNETQRQMETQGVGEATGSGPPLTCIGDFV